ncbi:MAG: DUF3037 domain-containing protein [Acidobacteria bacterium]|nr:MAG: DUF3037 domain-containing protein [Acidobacteriota bacterium]
MAAVEKFKECSLYLVQYVPDVVRGEFLNIGLFLFSPRENYLGCLFTDDFRRIKRFHPQADTDFLRELQQDFEQQIDDHSDDLDSYLHWMEQSFSNMVQIAPVRACLLRDPATEIQDLFNRYVGARVEGPLPLDTRVRIKQRLRLSFVRGGLWDRPELERNIPAARWTQLHDPFTFDFGYRPVEIEGKPKSPMKFVHALSLKRDVELAKVLVYTMGHVRRSEPAELTAIVEGTAGNEDEAATLSQSILEEAGISIQPVAFADTYAQSIRRELAF